MIAVENVGGSLALRTKIFPLWIGVILLKLPVVAAWGAPEKSIEALLQETESALLNGEAEPKPAPSKPKKTEPKPVEELESRQKHLRALLEAPPPEGSVNPIDPTAIQNVISVDLQASQKEREPMYPISLVSISTGVHSLSPVYVLSKDDDLFEDLSGGVLGGVYLAFSPTWKLGILERYGIRSFVSAVFQSGFSKGTISMTRAGVQTGTAAYSLMIFPIEAGLQLEVQPWKWLGFFGGYGPAAEVLHQDGTGVNDTITEVFYGDQFWFGINSQVSKTFQIFLQYRRKGTFIFRSPAFGGQVITAGVSFSLWG